MDFNRLYTISDRLLDAAPTELVRPGYDYLTSSARFLGLRGSRGVGKSTLLRQYGRSQRETVGREVLYTSLDDLFFRKVRLLEFAEAFHQQGGTLLLLDEVHRYGADWSVELKLIYDQLPGVAVRFTSSSIVELAQAKADLSRRAPLKDIYGLSFREYLNWTKVADLPTFSLDDIVQRHEQIVGDHLPDGTSYLTELHQFFRFGYYPLYWDYPEEYYYQLLNETVVTLLEQDLPPVYNITTVTGEKLKKLLVAIAESVPYKPNMTKLSEFLETNREIVQNYFYYLHQARLVGLLPRQVRGIIRTQKPEKVYLDNPNLLFALPTAEPSIGTQRETFFYNALTIADIDLGYAKSGDFETDKYLFEVGGPNKKNRQVRGQAKPGYRVLDGVDRGGGNRVPLWLFGLLV